MEILKIRARVVRHDFRDLAGKPDSRQGIFSDSPSLSDRDYFLYADLEDELCPRFWRSYSVFWSAMKILYLIWFFKRLPEMYFDPFWSTLTPDEHGTITFYHSKFDIRAAGEPFIAKFPEVGFWTAWWKSALGRDFRLSPSSAQWKFSRQAIRHVDESRKRKRVTSSIQFRRPVLH
jgi:hypothetical protein